jgi:hypothetical protein
MMGAIALLALSAPAKAEDLVGIPSAAVAAADPFSALVGEKKKSKGAKSRPVTRYAVASDGRMFIVEGKIGAARLKFLCADADPRIDCALDPEAFAEEIYLVNGVRGPRGDVIYKDETGATVLRVMSYGGATVFWPGKDLGEAASKSFGDDGPLLLPPADHEDAVRRAANVSQSLSAIVGATILFDPGAESGAALADPAEGGASVLADAIMRVATGMSNVAKDQTGARILKERIGVVRFTPSATPRLSIDGKVLTVFYNPGGDVAGRLSSTAVAKFLEISL